MILDKNYLKMLAEPIIKGKVIGTEEQYQLANNLDNIWARCYGKHRSNPFVKEGKVFRAILKSEFMKMGGFDPKLGYADDQTFFIKYGKKSFIAQGARCYHKNPDSLKEVYSQARWIGSSHEYFWMKAPLLNLLILALLYLIFPISILFLVVKKYLKQINRPDVKDFFGVVVFITTRYFGTLNGYFNRIIFKKNIR